MKTTNMLEENVEICDQRGTHLGMNVDTYTERFVESYKIEMAHFLSVLKGISMVFDFNITIISA